MPLHTTALPILGYQPHGWKIHHLVWRFPQKSVYIKYGSASHLWLPKGIYPKSVLIRTPPHTHICIYIKYNHAKRFIDCYRMEGSSWRSPKNSGPRCDQNWNAGLGEQQRLGQDNPGSTLTVHGRVWDISLSNVGKAVIDHPIWCSRVYTNHLWKIEGVGYSYLTNIVPLQINMKQFLDRPVWNEISSDISMHVKDIKLLK